MNALLYMNSPVGPLTICQKEEAISRLLFGRVAVPGFNERETPLLSSARSQLSEYFSGQRKSFDLPLRPEGTPFQQRVWQALLTIPYGETRSYAYIGELAGSPRGFRAVGMANHNNPIPIIIPCHRVIGKNGGLTGYAGGLHIKVRLLDLEASSI